MTDAPNTPTRDAQISDLAHDVQTLANDLELDVREAAEEVVGDSDFVPADEQDDYVEDVLEELGA